jgi:hypothetical protein
MRKESARTENLSGVSPERSLTALKPIRTAFPFLILSAMGPEAQSLPGRISRRTNFKVQNTSLKSILMAALFGRRLAVILKR